MDVLPKVPSIFYQLILKITDNRIIVIKINQIETNFASLSRKSKLYS
jgi:hypothetical protein